MQLDVIWGTRDVVSQKNVLEAGASSPAVQRLEESLDEAETQSAVSSRPSSSRSASEDTQSRTENDDEDSTHPMAASCSTTNQVVQKDKKEKQSKI